MNLIRLILALVCLPLLAADLDRAAIAQKYRELADLFQPVEQTPQPVRRLVAWTPGDYAPQSGYSSFTVGITRFGFILSRDCSDIQFHVTGRQRPAGIGSPGQVAELTGSPYELVINYEIRTPDRSTILAGPFQVRWDGKRLLSVAAGTEYASTPTPGQRFAGSLLEGQAFVSRLASVGRVIAGEPGQMTTTAPDWPRTEGIGGALGTFGVYGTRFTTSTSANLEAWSAALDAGTFTSFPADASGTLNQGGFAPIAVTGLTSDGRTSLIQLGDSTARSADAPNRTRRDSGTGYFRAATAGQIAGFQWSVSGQRIADFLSDANITQRAQYLQFADAALIDASSNDLKDGGTVEATESAFRAQVARLRAAGIANVWAANCLYRWVTSDNWRTFAGQSEQMPGFNAKAAAWDGRLAAMLAEGLIQRVIDRRTAVQDPAQGFKWRLPAVVASFAAADNSTVGNVRGTGQGWTTDLFTNRHISVNGAAPLVIFGNNASLIAVNAGAQASTVVPTGTPVEVLDIVAPDGVHPGPYGNALIAAALQPFNP